MYSLFPVAVFVGLIIFKVESLPAKLVLCGIVLGLWVSVGTLAAGIAAALFSVGILIVVNVPTISKL